MFIVEKMNFWLLSKVFFCLEFYLCHLVLEVKSFLFFFNKHLFLVHLAFKELNCVLHYCHTFVITCWVCSNFQYVAEVFIAKCSYLFVLMQVLKEEQKVYACEHGDMNQSANLVPFSSWPLKSSPPQN